MRRNSDHASKKVTSAQRPIRLIGITDGSLVATRTQLDARFAHPTPASRRGSCHWRSVPPNLARRPRCPTFPGSRQSRQAGWGQLPPDPIKRTLVQDLPETAVPIMDQLIPTTSHHHEPWNKGMASGPLLDFTHETARYCCSTTAAPTKKSTDPAAPRTSFDRMSRGRII